MKKCGLTLILIMIFSLFPFIQRESRAAGQGTISDQTTGDPKKAFLPVILNGAEYFVAPTGDDLNPGTFLSPWKTIGKAALTAVAGDTITIRGGIYYESVHFRNSGTADRPIRIRAYRGENPILDGQNSIPGDKGLLTISGNYIVASGLEVRKSGYDGIHIRGSYDIVDQMYVHHNNRHGIYITGGSYSIVENNRVWRNAILNEYKQAEAGSGSTAVTAARNGVYFATIRRNTVWENWGKGISTYESDHTVIEDNIIHDSLTSNVYLSDATNVVFQRNFVYTDPQSYLYPYSSHNGIVLGDELNTPVSANNQIINNISFGNNWNFDLIKGSSAMNNILIANNTFVNGIVDGGVQLRGYHQNVQFLDNIIEQDDNLLIINISLNPDVHFSNNLWSRTPPPEASGPGDLIQDPRLKRSGDPFSPDWFRLTSSSPAIGHAKSIPQVLVDFFGIERGSSPDIGADEYVP